ncbi:dirigent protein 10-like [Humulus lupulus]|uniref:dirigent protein 10-like n=1 Tax=Humulus lupulus TaxID=3486 RepID=UPI002B403012|nr:dirigent protein 10-like [Humulus lupulus]
MARATLEELEFGTVTPIEEGIYHSHSVHNNGPRVVIGKAQGIYVASSEEGSSHMMAITASFGDEANGLRFFGVRKKGVTESHIAVIGGVGKYQGANGYATLKRVNNSQSGKEENEDSKLFKFSVYLRY